RWRLLRVSPGPGLLGARSQPAVFRVPDLDHGETLGRHHLELASAHPFIADAHQPFRWQVALPDSYAGTDQRTHHAVAERISLHFSEEHAVVRAAPVKLLQRANGGGALPGLAEGGPVVEPEQRG